MSKIHATAIIEKDAQIADNAEIGPFCVIGTGVIIESNVRLLSHVTVSGHTHIGEATQIFPFASIGHAPQDLKYKGEKTSLIIGKNNVIREHVTMNPGTASGGGITKIGDNCLFMVGTHVAHDCQLGNNIIMANNATLAGHVVVDDYAIIGGLSAVHQFVRIGKHAIIGGMSGVDSDVIPYGSVIGERASLGGLNLVGLKRRDFDRETIHSLRNAYKMLFEAENGTLLERASKVQEAFQKISPVQEIIDFVIDRGSRSICTPRLRNAQPIVAEA
jgi:UDP-N-acetylglucosamine acyltransferase